RVGAARADLLPPLLAGARPGARDGLRRRVPGRLSGLRHGPLPPAPPHAADADGEVAAGAAHAPPLPGRRARLRDQRAVLGSRVRDDARPPRSIACFLQWMTKT